jgi:hypothetical protein
MTQTKAKTAVLIGTVIILVAGTIVLVTRKRAPARGEKAQSERIAATIGRIQQVNAGLPDTQIQAKTLIMAAMIQKRIPDAANWCDSLNVGNKLWPVTPTNTVFALNSRMAGHAYVRGIRGDMVVFFEASSPGWNQAGGPELLAEKAEGVAVAFMDGRAVIVPPGEIVKLRWAP